jgi:hypothetical protein
MSTHPAIPPLVLVFVGRGFAQSAAASSGHTWHAPVAYFECQIRVQARMYLCDIQALISVPEPKSQGSASDREFFRKHVDLDRGSHFDCRGLLIAAAKRTLKRRWHPIYEDESEAGLNFIVLSTRLGLPPTT